MNKSYQENLVKLAEEIHELQLKESDLQLSRGKTVGVSSDTIRLVSKINFLIGYILASKTENPPPCDCSGHKNFISSNDCVCSPDDASDLKMCNRTE